MSDANNGGDERVLQVLKDMSAAQANHGRALEALRDEFRSLNQSATYAAGVATLARHEAGTATMRVDKAEMRLEQLEHRLIQVEKKLST